jgi:hypothetical protein
MILRAMHDKDTPRPSAVTAKISFRKRYDDLERQRAALVERLNKLGASGRRHPSFSKATTLLARKFRHANLVQRAADPPGRDWLIRLIEVG